MLSSPCLGARGKAPVRVPGHCAAFRLAAKALEFNTMRYRAVLLDVGDTLVSPVQGFGSVYAEVFSDLGVNRRPEEFERALRTEWVELSRRHPPGRDRYDGEDELFWRGFAGGTLDRILGRPADGELVSEAVARIRSRFAAREAWHVYADVPPVLAALRERGVRLAIVSNWDSRLPSLLERLGLRRHFDAVLVSHLEGCEKPDPRLFRRALAALGVAPHEALHVGDVPELDWAGARAAGCAARLVDRRGRLAPGWRALEDLAGLPELVDARREDPPS